MKGPKIDMEALRRSADYQEWAREHWEPTQFPRAGSETPLAIDEISVLSLDKVIPDERGFMFRYPIDENSYQGHTADIGAESHNFVTPYHENLEEALKTYLRDGEITEAANVLRQEGRQVYVGKGVVLVKTGYGVWCNDKQQKQMGRFEARCKITPTVDLAPYLNQVMAWHPNARGLLDRLREFKGDEMPEGALLPEQAELVRWERDGSFGRPSATSTFYIWNSGKDNMGMRGGSPLTLLYRSEGLITEISLPSVRESNNHYANLVLARVRQKLPE